MNEQSNDISNDYEIDKTEFVKRLDKLMKKTGITLGEIAGETGVPKSNVHAWLQGSTPNVFQLAKVASFFDVSLDELVYGKSFDDNFFRGDYVVRVLRKHK